MWERKISGILLLVCICTAFSQEKDNPAKSYDVGLTLESNQSSESVFSQTKNCITDNDCHHLGKCETTGDGEMFCACKNGTSGDLCETVDECADELETCGTLDDVSCVFDEQLEKAVCKCNNDSKTYVPDAERCMGPCTSNEQCQGMYAECSLVVGNQKFCSCLVGQIGDFCELIEECYTKKVDCGVDSNATCKLSMGKTGKAYCQCDQHPTLGFDYDEKVCKDCTGCGESSWKEGGCTYRNGKRECHCWLRFYTNEEGICEDCKCGINGYGCSFENGTKICKCSGNLKQKGDVCETCDCGRGQLNCEFVGNNKVCTCKEGYATKSKEDSNCIEMCNDTNPCQNGGQCVQNFCSCLSGTKGDFCEIVEYCIEHNCKYIGCVYNVTSQEGSCECNRPKEVFDDYFNRCRECDCGTEMRSCSYEDGRKICTCDIPYAVRYGKCELCQCKNSSPYGCYFKEKYAEKVCPCNKGYVQYQDDCKECDCGENGKCSFNYWGNKDCKCNEGFSEHSGTCKACDCGSNGRCSFNDEGEKKCYCYGKFEEYEGRCLECDCGANTICKRVGSNAIQCSCRPGYASQYGTCRACNCDPGTDCEFPYGTFSKKCFCPKGYIDYKESCKACDCKVEGANCSLATAINTCQCPEGYEQVPDFSTFSSNYCDDIDECKRYGSCPSSTDCVNTIGSYECVCKEGYEEYAPYDIKKDGCRDKDQCAKHYKDCDSKDAKCVNTYGSSDGYECTCRDGYTYTIYSSHGKIEQRCLSDLRDWRTATIAVSSISGIIIVILILVIIGKKYRWFDGIV